MGVACLGNDEDVLVEIVAADPHELSPVKVKDVLGGDRLKAEPRIELKRTNIGGLSTDPDPLAGFEMHGREVDTFRAQTSLRASELTAIRSIVIVVPPLGTRSSKNPATWP